MNNWKNAEKELPHPGISFCEVEIEIRYPDDAPDYLCQVAQWDNKAHHWVLLIPLERESLQGFYSVVEWRALDLH
jgi:hypothetical protein